MNNKTSIYVYEDINDFLNQMENLNHEYDNIMHYHKYVKDIVDVRSQLKYLQKTKLLVVSGFMTKKIFKITIEDKGQKYCITYKFKSAENYRHFKHQIVKMEKKT